jgi:hypothetical protein
MIILIMLILLFASPAWAGHAIETVAPVAIAPAKVGSEVTPKRTENSKTFRHSDGSCTWGGTTGSIHYKEDYSDAKEEWKDIAPSYVEDKGEYLEYSRMPAIVRIYKDKTGYEVESRIIKGEKATVELVEVDDAETTKHADDADLSMTFSVEPNRVRLWKSLKTEKAPKKFKWKITQTGKSTLAFREDPEVRDRQADKRSVTLKTKKTAIDATSFYWEEESSHANVDIDTDFTYNIASDADDGYVFVSTFYSTSNELFLGDYGGDLNAFLRFTGIGIGNSATVDSAYVSLRATGDGGNTVNLNVYFNDADNATAPTDTSGYNGKAVTGAVAWNSLPTFSSGTRYTSPELKTIAQTVVNRAGWSAGNAMMVLIKNNGSTSNKYKSVSDYHADSTYAAILYMTYTPPAASFLPRIIIH